MKIEKFGLVNYKAFGPCADGNVDPLELEVQLHQIDFSSDAIIIVGENNIGKTSLLNAYRDFREPGFVPTDEDFFRRNVSAPILMEIKIRAEADDDLSEDKTKKWFDEHQRTARVRKIWTQVGERAQKYSLDPVSLEWVKDGFGGFDTILQNRLPEPIHIAPNMSADEMKGIFQKLFRDVVHKYISESSQVQKIDEALTALVAEIEQDGRITHLAKRISDAAAEVFPSLVVEIKNPPSEKGVIPLLEKQADVELKFFDGPNLNVSRHGQGAQRAFIMSALLELAQEATASSSKKSKVAPILSGGKIIQIEEPELYLSPTAVRRMRKQLFALATRPGVQVMACTHSPVMVDFSRPKQSIIRVERSEKGARLFQSSAPLHSGAVDALKLLYNTNPSISEALFAKTVVLVEGATELAVLGWLLNHLGLETDVLDIYVLDATNKETMPHIQRVLRAFGKQYIAVHDLDVRFEDRQSKPTAWNTNELIWEEIKLANDSGIEALGFVFKLEFEDAHGYSSGKKQKISSALSMIKQRAADNDLETCALYSLYECIRDWKSQIKSLDDVKAL